MNFNKFISYNIEHKEISRNNDKIFNIPEILPIHNYHFKTGQESKINSLKTNFNNNNIINSNSQVTNNIQENNLLNKSPQLLNFQLKENNNSNNIKCNYSPNSIKVYKAISYKNFLSKSISKQNFPSKLLKNYFFINSLIKSDHNKYKKKNNSNDNLLNELKKSIKIQSSKNINIESYSHKSKLLLSQNNNINRYLINSKGGENMKNENNIYLIPEEKNEEDFNLQQNLFNHRYSAQIQNNLVCCKRKLDRKKINITNKNNNREVVDNCSSIKNIKTCESEKNYKENKLKHCISSALDKFSNKLMKLNDNENINNKKNSVLIQKLKIIKKIKKRKNKKNKSANNSERSIILEKAKKINSKIELKFKYKEKEKNVEINENKKFIIFKNKNQNLEQNNLKIRELSKEKKNNNNSIEEIKKNMNLINNEIKNNNINIKTINSRTINNKIINIRDKLIDNKENDKSNNIKNIEPIKEKEKNILKEIKDYKDTKTNIDISENKENDCNYKAIETQPKTNKEIKYRLPYYYIKKEQSLERIVRTRKEYMLKGKSQSLENLNSHFYLIFPGNASYLIKNCMCHRTSWKEAFSNVSSIFNFKWNELSSGIDYSLLGKSGLSKQIVNHYENHSVISNKGNMFINLMNYCEMRKISVFKYVPFTIIFQVKDRRQISDEEKEKKWNNNLENLQKFIEKSYKYIKEYDNIGDYYNEKEFNEEKEKRNDCNNKINKKSGVGENKKKNNEENEEYSFRIENNEDLSNRKHILYKDIFPKFDIYDKTMIEDKDKLGSNTVIEIPKSHFTGKNMWVIKAINLNRGMCIKVVNNFKEMKQVIDKFKKGVDYHFTEEIINEIIQDNINIKNNTNEVKDKKLEDNKNNNNKEEEKNNEEKEKNENLYYCDKIIIQKYIENPLLYRGRKCDMRIWVLLTHQMKVYIFKEGHLKTCSVEYDANSKDAYSHITNYSFQKYNDNFQKYEKGNEVPFSEFQKFIDEKYPDKFYKVNIDLMNQLKEIVNITMRSAKDKINKNGKNYQFEIFGYDFMLDNDFNLFLIEINTNPGLEESSPWIKVIVPRMLDDALRLTLDQVFEPKYDFNLNYKSNEEANNLKNVENNLKNKINPNDVNSNNENFNCEKQKEENSKEKNENEEEKNGKKYISPFPVPGYELFDNLWEFVCDLNIRDPLDDQLDKKQISEETYTGIRHLLKKKNVKMNMEKNKKEILNKKNIKKDNNKEIKEN